MGEILENVEKGENLESAKTPKPRYTYSLDADTWKAKHDRVLAYTIRGLSRGEIADKLHVHIRTIDNIVTTSYFKERLAAVLPPVVENAVAAISHKEMISCAKDKLVKAADAAAAKIIMISACGQPQDRIQLEAAQAILDRAGIPKREEVEHISRNYTPEEISSTKQTVLEIQSITARVTESDNSFVLPQPKDPDATGEILRTDGDRPSTLPT